MVLSSMNRPARSGLSGRGIVVLAIAWCVLCTALITSARGAGAGSTVNVAISGNAAPGGGTFASFDAAALSLSNYVAYKANLSGIGTSNVQGVFRSEGSSAGALIIRAGQTVGGQSISSVGSSVIDNAGRVGSDASGGIFRSSGGGTTTLTLTALSQPGAAAPGGGTFGSAFGATTNSSDSIAFTASVNGVGSIGIFRAGPTGPVTQVARVGTTAIVDGAPFNFGSLGTSVMGSSGHMAFRALQGGGDMRIMRTDTVGSNITQLAATGAPAPAAPGASGGSFSYVSDPVVNGPAGLVAFEADIADSASTGGIFAGSAAANLVAIARLGQSTGIGSFSFSVDFPQVSETGHVAFRGSERYDTSKPARPGIWRTTAPVAGTGTAALTRMAVNGDAAAGGGTLFNVGDFDMAPRGQIAYGALVTPSGGGANQYRFSLTDGVETILVASEGDALAGSTVQTLAHPISITASPTRTIVNRDGQVACVATLADGRSGVFLFTPELHWRGPALGDWSNAANWTVGLNPSAVHDVFIDPSSVATTVGTATGTFLQVKSLIIAGTGSAAAASISLNGSTSIAKDLAVRPLGQVGYYQGTFGVLSVGGAVQNDGTININSGTANFHGAIDGAGSLLVGVGAGSNADVTANHVRLKRANINGRLTIRPDGTSAATSVLQSLTIDTGTLNLNNNALVVDYTSASPLASLNALVEKGYNAGSWRGGGITSGVAASTPGTALGIAEATDLFTTFPATFAGQTIDNSTVLIRYTRWGDANLDGTVDTLDFNSLAANFGRIGQRWSKGDFNFDGIVDTLDFNNLAANFGKSVAAPGSLVPEPSLSAAIMLWAGAMLRRKR